LLLVASLAGLHGHVFSGGFLFTFFGSNRLSIVRNLWGLNSLLFLLGARVLTTLIGTTGGLASFTDIFKFSIFF